MTGIVEGIGGAAAAFLGVAITLNRLGFVSFGKSKGAPEDKCPSSSCHETVSSLTLRCADHAKSIDHLAETDEKLFTLIGKVNDTVQEVKSDTAFIKGKISK